MAKADRLESMDVRRAELETEYEETLIGALRSTAAGSWGLFDHQQDRSARARVAPVIEALADLAETIDGLRDRLLLPPFALHEEFLAARGPVGPSAPGEPKQARAWLDRLDPPAAGMD